MPVLGAHSSSPSHTLKRIVRRPAKSPPSLAMLSASGTGRYRTPAPPTTSSFYRPFVPARLDRSRLAEVTRLIDSRKARTGLRRAGLFILSCGRHRSRARYGRRCRPLEPHRNSISRAQLEPVAAVQQPALSQVAPVTFPTSLGLVLNIIQRPGARRRSEPSKAGSAVLVRRLHDPAYHRMYLIISPRNSSRSRNTLVSAMLARGTRSTRTQ